MTTIAVTGGTGLLGRRVVERLSARGHSVRVLSHRSPAGQDIPAGQPSVRVFSGDLREGGQLATFLSEVDTVVHCASDPRNSEEVDVSGTQHLLEGMRRAGCGHLVYVSIVGVDRIPLAYYRAKLEAERRIEEQDAVPWTIQRATQFHPFIAATLAGLMRLPVLPVPSPLKFQPVDTGEVAERLVNSAVTAPAGRAPDFGGPRILTARELARTFMEANHRHRPLIPAPLPGKLGAAFRSGANLCLDQAHGQRDWQEFLTDWSSTPPAHAARWAA